MENLIKLNRRRWAVQLALTTGLALLFLAALLWGLQGVTPARADPGNLYVDGASGQDMPTCGTTIAPCQTISYTLNSRASDGDTILIATGTYTENLTITGITVTLRGGYTISGTQWLTRTGTTIVDGSQLDRTFVVHGGSDVTLEDMTITGGVAPEEACWGGGVQVTNGSATLRRTTVRGNQALCTSGQSGRGAGGGLNAVADEGPASLFVEDSFILDNLAGDHGSAVGTDHVTVVLTNVVIAENNYNQLAVHMSDFTLVNGTIANNSLNGCPILDFDTVSSIRVLNSIIWNSGSIACGGGGGTCNITYSDIQGGWPGTGNIDTDPLFVGGGDYHLQVGSPCIDKGTAVGAPTHDIEGTPRDAAPDMGAYEWTGFRIFLPLTLRNVGP
jgi:hypothetical protein